MRVFVCCLGLLVAAFAAGTAGARPPDVGRSSRPEVRQTFHSARDAARPVDRPSVERNRPEARSSASDSRGDGSSNHRESPRLRMPSFRQPAAARPSVSPVEVQRGCSVSGSCLERDAKSLNSPNRNSKPEIIQPEKRESGKQRPIGSGAEASKPDFNRKATPRPSPNAHTILAVSDAQLLRLPTIPHPPNAGSAPTVKGIPGAGPWYGQPMNNTLEDKLMARTSMAPPMRGEAVRDLKQRGNKSSPDTAQPRAAEQQQQHSGRSNVTTTPEAPRARDSAKPIPAAQPVTLPARSAILIESR